MQPVKEAATAFLANKRVAVTGSRARPRRTGATTSTGGCASVAMTSSPSIRTPRRSRGIGPADLKSIPGGVAVVIGTRPEIAEDTMHECAGLGISRAAIGPRYAQRLGGRHRLRPQARHHRDRRRLSAHVRGPPPTSATNHALRVRGEGAQAGLNREERTISANKKLLDRYVERYNAGDLDAVMEPTPRTPCRTCRTAPSWARTLYYDNVSVLA